MEQFFTELSILLVGSAILASLAIYLKQPIILAYVACGIIIGPWGLKFVKNISFIEAISHLGITLLLFLAGLNLHPQRLLPLFRTASIATLINSAISFLIGWLIPLAFGFPFRDSLIIGLAFMFSSTILVVKLLPTIQLHHKQMGAICISILILQDLLAVAVLAFIRCLGQAENAVFQFAMLSLKVALFIVILFIFEWAVLKRVMSKVDRYHEALFILGLAWCFGVASISYKLGLFFETGAFFSGFVLARHNISRFIAEELKPIRDFFLVLFFFSLGAHLNIWMAGDLLVISMVLTLLVLLVRPFIFSKTLQLLGEKKEFSNETGMRLGQLSEFGLLIGLLAMEENLLTNQSADLIQLVTIFTFIASSYFVFRKFPTPIGSTQGLKQD